MALIDDVKLRLGILYNDKLKNREIEIMIEAARAFFYGAGWNIDGSPLAVEAVALYCKMAQSTSAAELTNHPVLLAFIGQGRSETKGCGV